MIIVVENRKMKTGLVWKILHQRRKKSEPKSRITQIWPLSDYFSQHNVGRNVLSDSL